MLAFVPRLMAGRLRVVRRAASPAAEVTADPPPGSSALLFASNLSAGSDVRIVWDGSNLLSRTAHTACWDAYYIQQTGYYALAWHAHNVGSFQGDQYEFGTHPYPASDGTVDTNGQMTNGTAGSGTVHMHEMAGLGANDFGASPGSAGIRALTVVKGVWLRQARTVELIGGTTLRHTYWADLLGNPSHANVHDTLLSNLPSPSAPAFYLGASDWRSGLGGGGASSNDETPSCRLRNIKLFSAALSQADVLTEMAFAGDTGATSAGAAALWYINRNPTHTDVADDSSAAHSPSWANANRPTTWTN